MICPTIRGNETGQPFCPLMTHDQGGCHDGNRAGVRLRRDFPPLSRRRVHLIALNLPRALSTMAKNCRGVVFRRKAHTLTAKQLSIRNLAKRFSGDIHALRSVSFDVEKGEFLVIIGLSGSGKSTLLRCINHLHEPTGGQILLHGQDITRPRTAERRQLRSRVAMIFQQFNLIGRHTVLSNVLMGALGRTGTLKSILGLFSAQERKRALEYLDLVGIADKANIRADRLSGGQQQRVAIARALMQKPEILLADEPVSSLDPATCHVVMDYLKKINRELDITILCNLHFLDLVRRYARRVVALREGILVFEGDPKEIDQEWFRRIYGEETQDVHIE